MKVLICGGRTFDDRKPLGRALAAIHAETPISLVIVGGAPGADRLGQAWAESQRIPVAVYPANWNHLGRKAGPLRNQAMLDFGAPNLVVVFPGGPGTQDMKARAEAAGIRVAEPCGPPKSPTPNYAQGGAGR